MTDEILREKAILFVNNASLKDVDPLALADDVKITPLLYEVKGGVFAFAHSTILEYLAAEVLKSRGDRDKIITRAYFDPVLVEREVLPMMLGLLDDPAATFQMIKELPDSLTFTNIRLRARALGYKARLAKSEVAELFEVLLAAVKLKKPRESAFLKALAPSFSVDDAGISRFFVEELMKTADEAEGGIWQTRAIEAIKLLGTTDSLLFAVNAVNAGRFRFMRADAIDILGEIGDHEQVGRLLLYLDDDDDFYLGGRAVSKSVKFSPTTEHIFLTHQT